MTFTQFLKPLAVLLLVSTIGCGRGPKGEPGVPGVPGVTGSSGSGQIVSTMNCGDVISGVTSAFELNGLEVEYNAVLISGGDVYATAVIIDEGYQASGTEFYAANQVGAQNALVLVTADYVGAINGGLWEISLDRATLETSVIYHDPSLVSPVVMSFDRNDCIVQNF